MKKIYKYSFVCIFIWAGFVLAISFMEAPLKFLAPSVTTEIGVEIGRIIFGALNKVELVFSLILLLQIKRIKKADQKLFLAVVALLTIMAVQSVYLLPVLDRYAEMVINGGISPSNTEHFMYVILEILKVFTLFYIGYKQILQYKKQIINTIPPVI